MGRSTRHPPSRAQVASQEFGHSSPEFGILQAQVIDPNVVGLIGSSKKANNGVFVDEHTGLLIGRPNNEFQELGVGGISTSPRPKIHRRPNCKLTTHRRSQLEDLNEVFCLCISHSQLLHLKARSSQRWRARFTAWRSGMRMAVSQTPFCSMRMSEARRSTSARGRSGRAAAMRAASCSR